MRIEVLFFARGRELAGTSQTAIEVEPGTTTQDLLASLLEKYPQLTEIAGACIFALNEEYIEKNAAVLLKDGDEVALIPPISGG